MNKFFLILAISVTFLQTIPKGDYRRVYDLSEREPLEEDYAFYFFLYSHYIIHLKTSSERFQKEVKKCLEHVHPSNYTPEERIITQEGSSIVEYWKYLDKHVINYVVLKDGSVFTPEELERKHPEKVPTNERMEEILRNGGTVKTFFFFGPILNDNIKEPIFCSYLIFEAHSREEAQEIADRSINNR